MPCRAERAPITMTFGCGLGAVGLAVLSDPLTLVSLRLPDCAGAGLPHPRVAADCRKSAAIAVTPVPHLEPARA
jgi:hypothetical protein